MELNLGYQSATRQSWRENSMKELMIELIDEHPDADQKTITKLFLELAKTSAEHLEAAVDHAVNNTYNSLKRQRQQAERRASPQGRQAEAEQKAERKQEADAKVEAIKHQILHLNELMPNGKRMRFAVGTEMQTMGTQRGKEGAVWVKIGKKAGKKLVGQVFSEAQVAGLYKAAGL